MVGTGKWPYEDAQGTLMNSGLQMERGMIGTGKWLVEMNAYAWKLTTFFCDNRPANRCSGHTNMPK